MEQRWRSRRQRSMVSRSHMTQKRAGGQGRTLHGKEEARGQSKHAAHLVDAKQPASGTATTAATTVGSDSSAASAADTDARDPSVGTRRVRAQVTPGSVAAANAASPAASAAAVAMSIASSSTSDVFEAPAATRTTTGTTEHPRPVAARRQSRRTDAALALRWQRGKTSAAIVPRPVKIEGVPWPRFVEGGAQEVRARQRRTGDDAGNPCHRERLLALWHGGWPIPPEQVTTTREPPWSVLHLIVVTIPGTHCRICAHGVRWWGQPFS